MQGDPHDVCECGDYRYQHQAGVGSCCFNAAIGGPGHHGVPDCDHFRLSEKAARSPSPTEGDGNG